MIPKDKQIIEKRVVGYTARCRPKTPTIWWHPVVAVPLSNNAIEDAARIASKEILAHIVFMNKGENWFSFWDTHVIVVDDIITSEYYEGRVMCRSGLDSIEWPGIDRGNRYKSGKSGYNESLYRKNYLPGDLRILYAPPQPSWDHVFTRGIYSDPWPVDTLMHHEHHELLTKLHEIKELDGKKRYLHDVPKQGDCHGCGKPLTEKDTDDERSVLCNECYDQVVSGNRCRRCSAYGHQEFPNERSKYGCLFLHEDGTVQFRGYKRR